jgi:hypothetical protein
LRIYAARKGLKSSNLQATEWPIVIGTSILAPTILAPTMVVALRPWSLGFTIIITKMHPRVIIGIETPQLVGLRRMVMYEPWSSRFFVMSARSKSLHGFPIRRILLLERLCQGNPVGAMCSEWLSSVSYVVEVPRHMAVRKKHSPCFYNKIHYPKRSVRIFITCPEVFVS